MIIPIAWSGQSNPRKAQWMNEIEPSLVKIHAYWDEMRGSQSPGLINDDFDFGGQTEVVQVVRTKWA